MRLYVPPTRWRNIESFGLHATNAGLVTIGVGLTNILTLVIPEMQFGDQFIVDFYAPVLKGATQGPTQIIADDNGSNVLVWHPSDQSIPPAMSMPLHDNAQVWDVHYYAWAEVGVSSTSFTLRLRGASGGSNSTIAIGLAHLMGTRLKG